MPTVTQPVVEVTDGVDTHKDTHTVAAADTAGRVLGSAQFDASARGCRQLLKWLRGVASRRRPGRTSPSPTAAGCGSGRGSDLTLLP